VRKTVKERFSRYDTAGMIGGRQVADYE